MSFATVFDTERKQREVYGVSHLVDAAKVYLISYFLSRATDLSVRHKLLAAYGKYNRGPGLILEIGGGLGQVPGSTTQGISETISKTVSIPRSSLSGVGTFEEQIVEFINNSNTTKLGTDAELWIEIDE